MPRGRKAVLSAAPESDYPAWKGAAGRELKDQHGIDATAIAERPEAFAQKTVELLQNAVLRETMGRMAREKVVNHHSWTSVVNALESILDRVRSSKTQARAA